MAHLERQRVRFTGKRTGMSAISIKGIGVVEVGDTIEISAEEAEAWTTLLPMRNGEEGSDWAKVGGVYEGEEGQVQKRMMKQAEKHAPDAEDVLPADVNTEPAHEADPDGGLVEEYAEVVTTPAVEDEADKPEKRGKKGE